MYTATVNTQSGVATYKATLTVTSNMGEDTNILVVAKRTNNPVTTTNDNLDFINVASPADMLHLGTTEVYPDYYRVSEITMYFNTSTDMFTVMDEVLSDLSELFEGKAVLSLTLGTVYDSVLFDSGSYNEDSEFEFFEE
jgi:hypothetical protein